MRCTGDPERAALAAAEAVTAVDKAKAEAARAVLAARRAGCSVPVLAAACHKSHGTISAWTNRALEDEGAAEEAGGGAPKQKGGRPSKAAGRLNR